jgi:hypothetical protein
MLFLFFFRSCQAELGEGWQRPSSDTDKLYMSIGESVTLCGAKQSWERVGRGPALTHTNSTCIGQSVTLSTAKPMWGRAGSGSVKKLYVSIGQSVTSATVKQSWERADRVPPQTQTSCTCPLVSLSL